MARAAAFKTAEQTVMLRFAAALYALTIAVHTADHLRRGIEATTPQVLWSGILSTLVAAAAIALAFSKSRWAPRVAVAVGFANAAGVAAVHLLPRWSAFSDAFPGGTADGLSWTAVLLEISGALVFALAGAASLREGYDTA